MLKALIKKQYLESFRSYFVNAKTNKARSKGGTVGFFIFFAVAMLSLFAIFYGLAHSLSVFLTDELSWFYYALMGIISVMLGVFGSVFNTYASLYLSKDNELLLSMPIPPTKILLSRMALVEGLSLLYSGTVWLPTLVCSWINKTPAALSVVFGVLLLVVISLFVSALTCILGWVIAAISVKVKRKSFIVVILSVGFLVAYYFVVMRFTEYIQEILLHSAAVSAGVKKWANLFYQLGCAATGKPIAMLIFSAVSLILCGLCVWALSRRFASLALRSESVSKVKKETKPVKAIGYRSALLRREVKRFTASPSYMLNEGLGILLLPVIAVVFLIKNNALQELLQEFTVEIPELPGLLPIAVFLIVGMVVSMNVISTPSVSMEGKNLWILQSLPVSAVDVLRTKRKLHILLNIAPAAMAALVLCICLHLNVPTSVLLFAALGAFIWLSADFGLMIGVLAPNVTWTNETVPLKGINVLLAMLANWIMTLAVCGIFWVLRNLISTELYLGISTVILALLTLLLERWIKTKGAERFAAI